MPGGHEQLLGLGARLDRRLHAGEHEAVAIGGGGHGHVTEAVVRCGLGDGPRGDDLTGDDRREHTFLLLVAARPGERGGDDIGREQRTGRDVGAERVGDEGEVDDAASR